MIDRKSPFGPAVGSKPTNATIPAFAKPFVQEDPKPQVQEPLKRRIVEDPESLITQPKHNDDLVQQPNPTPSTPVRKAAPQPIQEQPKMMPKNVYDDDYSFNSMDLMGDDDPIEQVNTDSTPSSSSYEDDFSLTPSDIDVGNAVNPLAEDDVDINSMMQPSVEQQPPSRNLPRMKDTTRPIQQDQLVSNEPQDLEISFVQPVNQMQTSPVQNTNPQPHKRRSLRSLRERKEQTQNKASLPSMNAPQPVSTPAPMTRQVEEQPIIDNPDIIPVMNTLDSLSNKMAGKTPPPQAPVQSQKPQPRPLMNSPFRQIKSEKDIQLDNELVQNEIAASQTPTDPNKNRRGTFGAGAYRADIGKAVHTPGKVKNYRGIRVDPLGVLALYFALTPIGFLLGVMSMVRYAQGKYEKGRFIALLATLISAFFILIFIVGFTLGTLQSLPGGLQGFGVQS